MKDDQTLDIDGALADMADDIEIYKEVVSVFLSDTPKILTNLETAFQDHDLTTLNRYAHSIKSSSRSIGGMILGSLAEKLEQASKSDNWDQFEPLINSMSTEFKTLEQNLLDKGFGIL